MPVTIRDVAKRCGLSVSAVSKALNGYPDVGEETRERVLSVAREIGYYPNALARGLKTNRTFNLGAILEGEQQDSLLHTYFITILNGFKREAERRGYDLTLLNRNIVGQNLSYLNHCRYRNVDGVCLMCVDFRNPQITELAHSDVPVVTIDHLFEGRDCVLSDNLSGMEALVRHILGKGHRRIAYLYGTDSSVTDARLTAFRTTLETAGISPRPEYTVASHYHSTTSSREATRRLLALPEPPTCIIMTDDYSALGGMEEIQRHGLRIPEDISVAGYDGTALIQEIHPRLTTVRQDGEEIGRRAALRLLERIEHPLTPMQPPDIVAGRLLPGETVGEV